MPGVMYCARDISSQNDLLTSEERQDLAVYTGNKERRKLLSDLLVRVEGQQNPGSESSELSGDLSLVCRDELNSTSYSQKISLK